MLPGFRDLGYERVFLRIRDVVGKLVINSDAVTASGCVLVTVAWPLSFLLLHCRVSSSLGGSTTIEKADSPYITHIELVNTTHE